MGLVLPQEVKVKWDKRTKQWYIDKGYKFTKTGDLFVISVEDLSQGSRIEIKCTCDNCNKNIVTNYGNYNRCVKNDGKYYCYKCAIKLYATTNMIKTKLKQSISFKQWCYENLSKEKADEIIQRWDYELNKCSPDDIPYSSHGYNEKGYWFKCLDFPSHKSELNNINRFTSQNGITMKCRQCNTLAITYPELIKFFINQEDAYKYSYSSKQKILMKCPICGYTKKLAVEILSRQGFGCNKCSDGLSYPEKFMLGVLEQLSINYKTQYSRVNAKWCENYRYDFYLPDYNMIIEVHGDIHYLGWGNDKDNLKLIVENDKSKKKLALNNGVDKYIEINAQYSNSEWIKKSLFSSELNEIFDFDIIDWNECEIYAMSSFVKKACELWNNGIKDTNEIATMMSLHSSTISRYLTRGTKINLCDYDAKLSRTRKVICLNTNEIFNRIVDADKTYNICRTNISLCCVGKTKSAGKHPITGEKLRWMFYEDYIKQTPQTEESSQIA